MDVGIDGGTTGTSAVCNLPAREASRNGDGAVQQDNVVPNINMDVRMDGACQGHRTTVQLYDVQYTTSTTYDI